MLNFFCIDWQVYLFSMLATSLGSCIKSYLTTNRGNSVIIQVNHFTHWNKS